MTPEQLLLECDKMTHNERMFRLVEVGRLAASDATIKKTLATLAQGNVYQRMLATQAGHGSRDTAQVLRVLSDPSQLIRGRGLSLAIRVCSDEELQSAFTSLPAGLRPVLARKLLRQQRQKPIDLYLKTLAARADPELKGLLPYGSREIVSRFFIQTIEQLNRQQANRMARHHPELMLEHLRTVARIRETRDPLLLSQFNTLLPYLARAIPDQTLELVKSLLPLFPLGHMQLHPLALKRPSDVVDLMLSSGEAYHSALFEELIYRLDLERLIALATRFPHFVPARFSKLSRQQRLALYEICQQSWRQQDTGMLVYQVVSALPGEQRAREGRRHLALPMLATRPYQQFPYAGLLPWDEARLWLDGPLHSPDADLRGAALKALISAGRYEREHLIDVLQLVRARRNEQDPVRLQMLLALSELPHGSWQTEHLPDLAQIISDACNASDLSYASEQAMSKLVVHSFPFHAEWSAQQMAVIWRVRGRITIFQLDQYISDKDIRYIAPVLMPILRSWQSRENEHLLILLASALGRRMRVFGELAALLETTLNRTRSSYTANAILTLLCKHRLERAPRLIPELLAKDKSAITLSAVYTFLHNHRQDLLTPFLGQQAYKGRFDTGRTRFILPLHAGFQRWTPAQQETFALVLLEVVRARDQNRATAEWLTVISQLSAMPAIDFTPLIELARDERQPVREATMRALGRLDAGQGIPALLEALNDERARIAIYALRRSLLLMPQAETLAILRNAPLAQITVVKEVVRLIGELASEAAYQELIAWETRDLHRDVRVALLRAFWDYLDYPETWEIFTRAAQSPDTALARGVVHIPAEQTSPELQRRLAILNATLLSHPTIEVRMAALSWQRQHPLADLEHVLLTRLLTLMHSPFPEECEAAAQAVFTLYAGNQAALVGEALRGLLSQRRALHIACRAYASTLPGLRGRLVPTTRALLAALAFDPLTSTLRVELLIKGLPWEEIAPGLTELVASLHIDALERARLAIYQIASQPDTRLPDLETALAGSSDERLRWLALAALVAHATNSSGWNETNLARLEQYRADASPLVAEAAQFTFTV